jgi:hypothetical protein
VNKPIASPLTATVSLYALAWSALTLAASHNRYDWMLTDPVLAEQGLTYCTLPLDNDANDLAMLTAVALLPLLLLAAIRTINTIRATRTTTSTTTSIQTTHGTRIGSTIGSAHWAAYLCLALISLWVCKWFIFVPQCPNERSAHHHSQPFVSPPT